MTDPQPSSLRAFEPSSLRAFEPAPARNAALRAWLEYVAAFAIDWLDALDAGAEDLEDDETERVCADD